LIKGKWHIQGSAAQQSAVLTIEGERYQLKTETDVVQFGSLDKVGVSDRLGNVERKLTLDDGSVFVTKDNASVDRFFSQYTKTNSLIHIIESNIAWALVALVLTVVTGFAFFKWGVPWASHAVAHALPQKTGDIIGANTLEFLDDYFFEPSQLDSVQRQQIRDHFQRTLVEPNKAKSSISYTLHFRAWGEGDEAIPNALALPSGDIILTDKFVELSQTQDEIDSVLLHEMGHVEYRHTLEMIAQTTLVTTAIALFTGDASGAADMGVGLGSLLVSTSYSRGNEAEADQYAFEQMLLANIDPTSFADIMTRITDYAYASDDDKKPTEQKHADTKPAKTQNNDADQDSWLDYLSTHPSTAERVKQAKRYAKCYAKGLRTCEERPAIESLEY